MDGSLSACSSRGTVHQVEAVTHLYTYPQYLERQQGRADIEAALVKLSAELQLPHALRLKSHHVGRITVPDSTPDETWAAMGRAVPTGPSCFFLARPIRERSESAPAPRWASVARHGFAVPNN